MQYLNGNKTPGRSSWGPGPLLWLLVYFLVFLWSAVNPHDYFTWLLEVAPAIVALVVILVTYRSFRLTNLSYLLILIHCVILMVGGHYTYAEVPLFDSIAESLGSDRNNYDKVGHFAQGFVPSIVAREVLKRRKVVNGVSWLNFIAVCFCLAVSAFYELIEWWVAELTGESAEAFLGTQGYAWDTQSDMALALIGAVLALVFLSRVHDRQLECLRET
ncbi:MAG: DUF2238 domain-containing protein [Gammaproteobacteria bacterium]|nr:DUF2238 domain-containing protein [Gammaproteobacteria bacterium]